MKFHWPALLDGVVRRSPRTFLPDACLLVHDETLIHVGTGRHCGLAEIDDFRHPLDAERLAEAARRLLPAEADSPKQVALALPPHEFVATSLHLPGVAPENVYNATRLQLPMLLPGLSHALLLAVQPRQPNPEHTHVALWLPEARAEALFQAFQHNGLLLARILPRPLVALPQDAGACVLVDEDQNTVTRVEWRDGGLARWLYLPRQEYEEGVFRGQFEQALAAAETAAEERKLGLAEWERAPVPGPATYRYGFTPPGASRQMRETRQRRRRQWLGGAAAGVFGLIVVGVGAFLYYERHLEGRLAELRARTLDVSQVRAEILEIEEKLGPILKFPRQDIVSILEKLDGLVPKDSWITALKIEAGVVEFDGQGANPSGILETLTAQPEFAEVALSKPIQGQTFGIRFRLVGIDVPAYIKEYIPTAQP